MVRALFLDENSLGLHITDYMQRNFLALIIQSTAGFFMKE